MKQVRHSQGTAGTAPTRDGRELFFMRLPGPPDARVPTVVFEGGLAASRSYWAPVQAAVAEWAPAVVYDRSGLGRSAPDPRPRPVGRLAADLGELLDHLGPGPFVLAGHSWGGPIVRLAAGARPGRIAGLVLVDPSDESCDLLFRPALRRAEKIGQVVSSTLARAGLLGFAYRGLLAALPEDARRDMRAEGFTVGTLRTRAAELASVVPDLLALRENPPELPGIPVTVISGALTSPGMGGRVRDAATASHEYRATRSARGRHVHARESGHMVPATEPGLIAAEIRRLVLPSEEDPGGVQ
ncbi:alpha/beta fold hydrolase [Amycolatopsis sp. NPDC059021]|uniref:alpha/beta fold hydrolase n=1 Tax=Amycolatopsis sp. NPDC059021 TaxID=3346704 RepID=UPI00366C7416